MYAANAGTDGLIDLWFNDGTHPSKWGSYLSALTVFGSVTGLDPQSLGYNERAARDLGISREDAYALQQIAAVSLGFQRRRSLEACRLFLRASASWVVWLVAASSNLPFN